MLFSLVLLFGCYRLLHSRMPWCAPGQRRLRRRLLRRRRARGDLENSMKQALSLVVLILACGGPPPASPREADAGFVFGRYDSCGTTTADVVCVKNSDGESAIFCRLTMPDPHVVICGARACATHPTRGTAACFDADGGFYEFAFPDAGCGIDGARSCYANSIIACRNGRWTIADACRRDGGCVSTWDAGELGADCR